MEADGSLQSLLQSMNRLNQSGFVVLCFFKGSIFSCIIPVIIINGLPSFTGEPETEEKYMYIWNTIMHVARVNREHL